MEDSAEVLSSCSLNSQETVVPEQTDFDPFKGLLGEPNEQPEWDVIEASRLDLKVFAPKNTGGEVAEKVRDLLLRINWSVGLYAQFWGVEVGEDGRRKSLECKYMPYLIKDYESALFDLKQSDIIDPLRYRGLCIDFVQMIAKVEVDWEGKVAISKSKLIDAFIESVPAFALNEDGIGCQVMEAASGCGYKVCIYLPLYDAGLGSVGVLELAVSKAENTHVVYADFVKGLKGTTLRIYNQVPFGETLYRMFPPANKKSTGRKGKIDKEYGNDFSAEIVKDTVHGKVLVSAPELASNSLWSQSNSKKRGLSAEGLPPLVDGKKPRKYGTFRKPAPGSAFSGQGSAFSGQQLVCLPPTSIAPVKSVGSLTVKIKFSEAKWFARRVISYGSASFAKIQEIAEECLSVESGTYKLCYVEDGGDLIRLESQGEMQDALSQITNHEIKILADLS